MTRKRLIALAASAAAALALAGCAGGQAEGSPSEGGGGDAAACANKIVNPDAEQVTVWAWYPAFEGVVDVFNNSHDDVQVCWVNAGVGKDVYPKFSTALEAGSGAPDVIQLENEVIPSFTIRNGLADLTEFGISDREELYAPGAWSDVSSGSAVYAVPVDLGPVGMLYRADILEESGIEVPTTWDEMATASKQLKAAGAEGFLANYPTNGRSFSQALFAQAGNVPFDFSTENIEEIGIDVNDSATKEVLEYWFELIDAGVVSADDRSTPDFNAAVVNGRHATYLAAAWGPGYLMGLEEDADPEARWAAAPLPQWDPANPVYVNWGGSSFGVTSQAQNPEAAALVASELFGTEEAWQIGIEQGALFPTYLPVLESDYFVELEYPFFGGQKINKDVFLEAAAAYEGFTFSPFQTFAYDKLTEAQASVLQGTSTIDDALDTYQKALEDYATAQGFTLK
ncbi:multiple sugar transport system substrate-binding protein [Microbacterium trichothecenolyticum]|uniref:ABC transporter substrate-binding protein n=1 Tax=Microbacterium trichothecenolyticum TaxID=69370 RepID=UPI002859C92D|nr:extracellular solute-binding protein [Microbacterium trichothecenolyticum]MDR7187131.1 multiple sugar transport system substrate-binding protein [Microbacterium trichothecenolyticum]